MKSKPISAKQVQEIHYDYFSLTVVFLVWIIAVDIYTRTFKRKHEHDV